MNVAIKVEAVSKTYRLGEIGTGTLSHDLHRWMARLRGKEDPFLKVEQKVAALGNKNELVYSLRDIELDILQGEAVGIIGRNGAGKSTLLKILSRITSPSSGRIRIRGRVASLLEVGTGFHPELTGKENIYLNGAILGMRKKEIDRKLEEIIDFSGVENYIDTPVKRYSSGMYVRLAFAVAAHLESEILIVDEVLAVGDAEFQKKCLGKMSEVSKGEGKTVLFVSHHMPSIKSLCNGAIILKNGRVDYKGNVSAAIEKYFDATVRLGDEGSIPDETPRYNTGEAKFRNIALLDLNGNPVDEIFLREQLDFNLILETFSEIRDALIDIQISSADGVAVTYSMNVLDGAGHFSFSPGTHVLSVKMENGLQPGNYTVTIGVHSSAYGTPTIDYVENVLRFTVSKLSRDKNGGDYNFNFVYGYVRPATKWNVSTLPQ